MDKHFQIRYILGCIVEYAVVIIGCIWLVAKLGWLLDRIVDGMGAIGVTAMISIIILMILWLWLADSEEVEE